MGLGSLLLLAFISSGAWAQVDRSPLRIKTPPPGFDLIKETDAVSVMNEESVQKSEPESRHVLTFMAGEMSAKSLVLTSNDETIGYDLSRQTPFFGASLGYYPAFLGGRIGLMSSVGYSYREQINDIAPSALHLLNSDILLSYRYESSEKSWIKPFAALGPGINIAFQRGADELNTSEAHGLAVLAAGFGFNVKRLFDISTPLDYELQLQYKRWFDPRVSNANYNGDLFTLGVSMVL